jgi:hypothetical protein
LVRLLIVRKLTIIVVLVIGFLFGVATAVAYYAGTGEHEDPVKSVTVPSAEK